MRGSFIRVSSAGADRNTAVFLLYVHALLIGIFCSTFDITAHSLFLSHFDEKYMARAYIFSGIAGLILTYICSEYGKKIRSDRFATLIHLIISPVIFVLWILLIMIHEEWVITILFIAMWPLNAVVMLGFTKTAVALKSQNNGIFRSEKARVWIIAGIMAGSFLITILVSAGLDVRHFILIGFSSILLSSGVLILAVRKNTTENTDSYNISEDFRNTQSVIKLFTENLLFRRITFFTILSVITTFFIRYSFMAVTRVQYPSMEDMAHFLGLFTACMMIFTLILSLFVYPYLLRNFRLRGTIAIPPLMIAGLTISVVFSWFISGHDPLAPGITIFFVLLALSRLFSGALKESVESPSTSVLLGISDKNESISTDPGINLTIHEAGTLFSGLILTGIGLFGFISLIYFPLILLVISLLWMITGIKLYSAYRHIICRTKEAEVKPDIDTENPQDKLSWENRISAEMEFADDFLDLITGDITAIEKDHNHWYIDKIIDHAGIKKDINLLPALKKIRSGSGIPRETRIRTSGIIQDLELLSSGLRQNVERLRAMLLLAGDHTPPVSEVLKFLRDRDNDLKIIALGIIKKFRFNELLPDVCGCLENPEIRLHAENALKSFRGSADQALRRFYLLSSGNPVVASTILRVLANNCSSENTEFLFSLLWSGTRSTREAALRSLTSCNYQISPGDREKLIRVIIDVAGIITWNISAGIAIGRLNKKMPAEAIDQENKRWISFLFNLLSVAYGNEPVREIRENIEEGTSESISHALEMMEILFDDQVKARLTTLFDRMPAAVKLRTLFRFHPGEIPEHENLFGIVINRDYNLLGVWVRACLIREIPQINGSEMAESLIALLFSPELILRQETAKLLSRSGSEYYRQASDRIPGEMRGILDNIINGKVTECELLYNKVIFLKSLLHTLPEEKLLPLAAELRFTELLLPEYLPDENGYILWECNSRLNQCRALIFYDNILRGISLKEDNTFCYILPLNAVTDHLIQYPEHSLEIFRLIDEIERRNQ